MFEYDKEALVTWLQVRWFDPVDLDKNMTDSIQVGKYERNASSIVVRTCGSAVYRSCLVESRDAVTSSV